MKLTLSPTATVQDVNGTPCRLWIGNDETGLAVHAWVALVQPQSADKAHEARYAAALREVGVSHSIRAIDARFVV